MKVLSLMILFKEAFVYQSECSAIITVCVIGLPSSVMTVFTTALGHRVWTALNTTLIVLASSRFEIAQATGMPTKLNKVSCQAKWFSQLA